jgi:hypothetical protein
MKIATKLLSVLFGLLLLVSGCATLSYSEGDTAERINWREYNDC